MQPANDNSVSVPPLCSYSEGMFSNEPLGAPSMSDEYNEMLATCVHEAAHAVVGYAFGEPLFSIGTWVHRERRDGGVSFSYGGEVRHGPAGQRRLVDFPYRPMHFRLGVVYAAGPAAERRYLLQQGLPLRLLGHSTGDHLQIDCIGKALEDHGRDRWAYRRLVWYAAQRLAGSEEFWSAINDVADDLSNEMLAIDEDETQMGTWWAYIEPRDVYRACRRAGLKHGMFRVSTAGRRAA